MTLFRSRPRRCWGLLLAVLVLAVAVPARAEDGLTQPGYGTGVGQGPDGTYRPHVIVRQYRAGSPGTWTTVSAPVPTPCWYEPSFTGPELFEYYDSGQANRDARHMGELPFDPPADMAAHKDEGPDEGRWWSGLCSSANWPDEDDLQGFFAYVNTWFDQHPIVWVPVGSSPPVPPIPPSTLMRVAYNAMRLPGPELAHNPPQRGVVNLATWIWAEPGSFTEWIVEARSGDVWARVHAKPVQLHLSTDLPATINSTCRNGGTPYDTGRPAAVQQTDCSITFRRSTVGRPAGATVRATITWEVSWEGSDGSGGPLDPPANPAAGVVQIPVQEIQTVVSP
jgi:hypothetical protein